MRTGVEVANTRIDWWIYLSVGEIGKYTGAIKIEFWSRVGVRRGIFHHNIRNIYFVRVWMQLNIE